MERMPVNPRFIPRDCPQHDNCSAVQRIESLQRYAVRMEASKNEVIDAALKIAGSVLDDDPERVARDVWNMAVEQIAEFFSDGGDREGDHFVQAILQFKRDPEARED